MLLIPLASLNFFACYENKTNNDIGEISELNDTIDKLSKKQKKLESEKDKNK